MLRVGRAWFPGRLLRAELLQCLEAAAMQRLNKIAGEAVIIQVDLDGSVFYFREGEEPNLGVVLAHHTPSELLVDIDESRRAGDSDCVGLVDSKVDELAIAWLVLVLASWRGDGVNPLEGASPGEVDYF